MTVAEAIPRQMRTVGCTWDEAAAFVGVSFGTLETWMKQAAVVHRGASAGRPESEMTATERVLLHFIADVDRAAAEVTIRWQGILEQEGRGGYPVVRTKETVRTDAEGNVLERRVETVTEIARPNVDAIMWKMEKQLKRYRREREIAVINLGGGNGIVLPEPTDDEAMSETAAAIREFAQRRQAKAIEATASDVNGHG
jgi:hypothetical protein